MSESAFMSALNFNPLPPRGGRPWQRDKQAQHLPFQSTPSSRRETCRSATPSPFRQNFNPLPPRGGRQRGNGLAGKYGHFNPLPPRGGRQLGHPAVAAAANFNPLPPRGGRPGQSGCLTASAQFQSTPSSRRETDPLRSASGPCRISIHSLLAEGDTGAYISPTISNISIHSLLAEGDFSDVNP